MRFESLTTALLTDEVPAATKFLVEILGFTIQLDIGWFVSLRHPGSGAVLDLWQSSHETVPLAYRRSAGGVVLAFMVDDVDAEYARLLEAGISIAQPVRNNPWGQRNFLAAGPDGIRVDILQRIAPDLEWLAQNGLG